MRFIDRLKQGLRELGRGAPSSHPLPVVERAHVGADRMLEFKRRSELDPATASPGPHTTAQSEQHGETLTHQPPASVSTCLKKAVLSKARRAVQPRQAAAAVWSPLIAPARGSASLFDNVPGPEGQGMFAGAKLTGADHPGTSHPVAHSAPAPAFAVVTTRAEQPSTQPTGHPLWGTPPPTLPGFLGEWPSGPALPPPLFEGASLFASNDEAPPSERLF